MKKIFRTIILLSLILMPYKVIAAEPNLISEITINLPSNIEISQGKIVEDGYLVSGKITPDGSTTTDAIIIKYNKAGDEEWRKVTGTAYDDDYDNLLYEDEDGYVVAGTMYQGGSHIVKYRKTGEVIWERTWGNQWDPVNNMIETDDAYVFILYSDSTGLSYMPGKTSNDVAVILKINKSDGSIIWQRYYDNGAIINQIIEVEDGYVVIGHGGAEVGATTDGHDFLLFKVKKSNGDVVFQTYFGGNGADFGYFLTKKGDKYIVKGITGSSDIPGITLEPVLGNAIVSLEYDLDGNLLSITPEQIDSNYDFEMEALIEKTDFGFIKYKIYGKYIPSIDDYDQKMFVILYDENYVEIKRLEVPGDINYLPMLKIEENSYSYMFRDNSDPANTKIIIKKFNETLIKKTESVDKIVNPATGNKIIEYVILFNASLIILLTMIFKRKELGN